MYELLDDADPNLESKMIRIPHYKWILPNNVLFFSVVRGVPVWLRADSVTFFFEKC